MPIYTYICKDCGENFDLLVGVTAKKTELKCSKCNSKNIKKTFSSFSAGGSDSSRPSCPTGTCNL
ncbi:MAG: zinc ribbon domain-containing protein [Candidatus Auribacterota bacterium]|nr:zinc ribbon domain-containing protein [Candidatus Auribacterota bacterium]